MRSICFLQSRQFWGNPSPIYLLSFFSFFRCISFPLDKLGCNDILCPTYFSLLFCVLFKNISSQNCGIFHNFNIGLFWRHPGQCGTPWSMTGMGIEWFDSKTNCVKRESNNIRVKVSQTPSKNVSQIELGKLIQIKSKTLGRIESVKPESNPVKNLELNWFGNIYIVQTANANDGARGGG